MSFFGTGSDKRQRSEAVATDSCGAFHSRELAKMASKSFEQMGIVNRVPVAEGGVSKVYEVAGERAVWKVEDYVGEGDFTGSEQACRASRSAVAPPFLGATRTVSAAGKPTYATKMERMDTTLDDELQTAMANPDAYEHWASMDAVLVDLVRRLRAAEPLCHLDIAPTNIMLNYGADGFDVANAVDWDGYCAHIGSPCEDDSTYQTMFMELGREFISMEQYVDIVRPGNRAVHQDLARVRNPVFEKRLPALYKLLRDIVQETQGDAGTARLDGITASVSTR